jgi:phosphoribosylaminoimidazole synthetase
MVLEDAPLKELTFAMNGLAMQTHRELRAGHREELYQRRLAELVRGAGYQVELEKRVEVFVNESLIGYMVLDLWVEQCLVIECKALKHLLTNAEVGQVVTYLGATGAPVGLLYNFGRPSLEWKRVLPPAATQAWQTQLHRFMQSVPNLAVAESFEAMTPLRFSVVSLSSQTKPAHSHKSVFNPSGSIRSFVSSPLYESSGVSITAGNRAVDLMRDAVKSTYGPEVLAGIGAFGGLFDASALTGLTAPALVASTDGVGTKVKLAAQAGRYESIGHDIVNHCINDILVQGAKPLFFLDYVASSKLAPEMVATIVRGMAAACRAAGCALLGGETAEMPGVYQPNEFDVAGTIVGVVERAHILPRAADLHAGDVLLGLASSGPHTNGFSLIRTIFENVPLETAFPELGGLSLADALLAPHRSYLNLLYPLLAPQWPMANCQPPVKALAHLTGGGFLENIPRVLPPHLSAQVRLGSWPVLPIFSLIQAWGDVSVEEMHRVFNMGIGMVVIVAPDHVASVQAALPEPTYALGELVDGDGTVTLI